MKDVIDDINEWQARGDTIGLATVVQTWGSAPRQVGAKMAFTTDGAISGSVSGGCVEGAVIEAGQEALHTGQSQLLHFGVADETAWDVGLACGGEIDIFVQPLTAAVYDFHREIIQQNQSGFAVTLIRGPGIGQTMVIGQDGRSIGSLDPSLKQLTLKAVQTLTHSQRVTLTEDVEAFVELIRPAPTMIIVGGVHIAIALTNLAKTLGYRTIVIDPRRTFGSQTRFPDVDQLIQAWPEKALAGIELTRETAVALLTHDPKIDDPALKIVLNSPVFYIGALGSRKTHAKRQGRLRQMGFSDAVIGRIHAPIGLDIGARSPEEIGLAIMAEVVRLKNKG
jgi:xanthine dehydrogenase accessory factor